MAIHAQFEHSSLSVTGTEHFLQPPEAAVWARAAFVWRVHHRHWSGPLLQVGSWKYCTCMGHEVMPAESLAAADECWLSFGCLCTLYAFGLCVCCSVRSISLTVRPPICLSSHRKRTMFQNIVNATEPMTDEKEAIAFISNNPTRKEIVMYVT